MGSLPSFAPGQQPSSIGFEDPSDVRGLFDYRLPDWGYRRTQVSLEFGGNGLNDPGVHIVNAAAQEGLKADWYGESEPWTWSLDAQQAGLWVWHRIERPDLGTQKHHTLSANMLLSGESRYYGTRSWALIGAAGVTAVATDDDTRPAGETVDAYLEAGIGLGRVRDVTPFLQARRVSERLRAIGREPLSPAQVRRLAAVLAERGGYLALFDRPERRFWGDAFDPLAEGQPFTPFELYYLSEIIVEKLGTRREGFQLDLTAQGTLDAARYAERATTVLPHVRLTWSHNRSLNSQRSVVLDAQYRWQDRNGHSEWGTAELLAEQLWVVADRIFWTNSARAIVTRTPGMASVWSREAGLRSAFEYYVEDRVSLRPELNLGWGRTSGGDRPAAEGWNWSVVFVVNYELEKRLF